MNYSQYDEIADSYDGLFVDDDSLLENNEVGEMLLPLAGSVLDIGCGTGLLTEIVNIDPFLYCGIDPSVKMLKRFYDKHPDFLHTIVAPYDGRIVDCERFDNIISLFGAASYLEERALQVLAASKRRKFLMFYKENYYPMTYKKCGVEFEHGRYTKEMLAQLFSINKVEEYRNYLIVR